jgi:hypothetical protein
MASKITRSELMEKTHTTLPFRSRIIAQRELEVKERKQQQVLKRSQRALKGSVSHTMLRPDFKGMTSVVPDSSKAGLQRKPDEGADATS